MKYLNTIFLVVAVILTCNIGHAETKHKEVDDIHRYIMGDSRDTDNNNRVFIPGMSNNQKVLERLEEEQRVQQARTSESFTGYGSDIKVVGESWDQCVIYAKRVTGITRSLGYAGTIKPQTQEAKIGAIALEWNHASVVIADYGDSIRVKEANWIKSKITERTVPKSRIRGYIYR